MDLIKWRKAKQSDSQGGACVEVAALPDGIGIGVRDSKNPDSGHLTLTPTTFRTLLNHLKN